MFIARSPCSRTRIQLAPAPTASHPRGMRRAKAQCWGRTALKRSLQDVSLANSAASPGEEHDLALLATRLYDHNAPVRGSKLHLAFGGTAAVEHRDTRAVRVAGDGTQWYDECVTYVIEEELEG